MCGRENCSKFTEIETVEKGLNIDYIAANQYNLFAGAQLSVKTKCTDGHELIWRSSANLRNESKSAACINIALSSSIILTGQTFSSVQVNSTGFFLYNLIFLMLQFLMSI